MRPFGKLGVPDKACSCDHWECMQEVIVTMMCNAFKRLYHRPCTKITKTEYDSLKNTKESCTFYHCSTSEATVMEAPTFQLDSQCHVRLVWEVMKWTLNHSCEEKKKTAKAVQAEARGVWWKLPRRPPLRKGDATLIVCKKKLHLILSKIAPLIKPTASLLNIYQAS